MAVSPKIEFKSIDDLKLDPRNPRLGRAEVAKGLSQDSVLEILKTWSLFELAQSMALHGYWPQEALLVVEEEVDGKPGLVVVEGNRRLAAAKLLLAAKNGAPINNTWAELAKSADDGVVSSLKQLPVVRADARADADAFLGYRHVTGIKEWHPAEKAEFIAHLVRNRGMSYQEVANTIGSKGKVVGRNFVTYQILMQLEENELSEEVAAVEERFSVLFLALRNSHIRSFIGLKDDLPPKDAIAPVPTDKLDNLADLVGWLFGSKRRQKVVRESRQVEHFAFVLSNPDAIQYLRTSPQPQLDFAYRIAGGEGADVADLLETAAYSIEQALSVLQHHAEEKRVVDAAQRLARDVRQVANTIPAIKATLCPDK